MSSHLFTYAVGDVHGDHALLTTLLDRIHDHADGEDYRLVFLGNAIDHGPNGAAVLSALRAMELRAPDRVIALRGWHEAMMAEAERDPEALALWLRHGGDATLRSFGATRLQEVPREVADWVARRPAEWRDALRRYVGGPELAEDDAAPGLHVVHGALPVRPTGDRMLPEGRPGVTCIDTGAGFGGPLTAAVFTDLQPEPVGFFQAQEDGRCLFIPPRHPAPLGRDPRLALRHVDGEPETAADWSIRQDAEHIEARLAAKRRQARRRQLLATAAGLVLLVGGAAVLWRPALYYVSAPPSVRWPLAANESARAPLGGSDLASLTPQLPASPGQPAVGPAEAGAPASAPAAPRQAEAAPPPAQPTPASPDAAESASEATEPGPQRAHALPPLPDAPASFPAPAGVAAVAPEVSPTPRAPESVTPDAAPTPPLIAHALPTPEPAPAPARDEGASTPPTGNDITAVPSVTPGPAETRPPSPSMPAEQAIAAAPTGAEPSSPAQALQTPAAPATGDAASSPAAPEAGSPRVAEAEPPLAPLLSAQEKQPDALQAQTPPTPSAGETAAAQPQAASEPAVTAVAPTVEQPPAGQPPADQPAAVVSAPSAPPEPAPGGASPPQETVAAATPDAPASTPDTNARQEAAATPPEPAGTPDAETTAAFNRPVEPPSAPPALTAEAPATERTETAMLTPAAPVDLPPGLQAPVAVAPLASAADVHEPAAPQPPSFVLATSFTLASPLSAQPGWRAVATSPDTENARPRAAFAALPAMSTPDLLDDAAPPFVASMPATTAPSVQPAEAATPKPVARPPARASAPAALRRPPARVVAPAVRNEPAQASQAAGPIDLRSQQPKPPAARGRLPAPSPASGQLY